MARGSQAITVLCPLKFEAAALRRLLRRSNIEVECTGPGRRGIESWFADRHGSGDVEPPVLLLLAGLAGSLTGDCSAGSAYLVTSVVDPYGQLVARSSYGEAAGPTSATTITSTVQVVRTPEERRALHQRSGADLVDLESETFVRLSMEHRLDWLIVRGVSDAAHHTLPEDIGNWFNERGASRIGAVVRSLARHPSHLRTILELRRRSVNALNAVASCIQRVAAGPPE